MNENETLTNGIFQFTRHPAPRAVNIDSLAGGGFTTFFALGIVNPLGPTLNVLAGDGIGHAGEDFRLLYVMLNPFSQECSEVGRVKFGTKWSPVEDLRSFFSLPF